MKKLLPLLLLAAVLAGCSCMGYQPAPTSAPTSTQPAQTGTSEPAVTPTATVTDDPPAASTPETTLPPAASPTASAAVPTQTPVVETVPPPPTPSEAPEGSAVPDEETALAAYQQAAEAWGWFHGGSMPYDPTDSVTVNELVYCRVDRPGIGSLAALRGYLKNLFSDELVDGLFRQAGSRYLELDGALRVCPPEEPSESAGGTQTRQVLPDTPERLWVRVTVEWSEETDRAGETYHFPYEKVGERWIFTNFSLVG